MRRLLVYRVIIFLTAVSIGLTLSITGCAINFKYDSPNRIDKTLDVPYQIEVSINTSALSSYLNNEKNIQEIKQAIADDIRKNVFRLKPDPDTYRISVSVNVTELEFKNEPWGLLWFPLIYLGAPGAKNVGTANVQISLIRKDGEILKKYDSDVRLVKWRGLYYGNKYNINKEGGITKMALQEAMEDIKRQINQDRVNLLSQIEEMDGPEKPVINSGQRRVRVPGETRLAIAVADIESENLTSGQVGTITNLLRESLWKTDRFDILERDQMSNIIKEKKIQLSGCTETKCAADIGRALNVEEMVFGRVDKLGDMYIISVRFVNVESIKVTLAESVRCEGSIEQLPEAVDNLTESIVSYFE